MPRLIITIDRARLRRRRAAVLLTNVAEALILLTLACFIARALYVS